ncbi:MAG: sodium:solute symporter [bacterium]|jgi:Na+/proline symporter|nr:sodium:solute symporter [candidate division KSB1 bacterium]MDH7558920.1 sodium:solute symporter [bacterium]
MMSLFAPLDWFWLLLITLLMVVCGVFFYRLGKRSQSDFFLAGRGLPWWLPASSVYATHTATDTPIWIGGVIYKYGLAGLWYTFFCAWAAVSAFVSARIFRRSLAYSQAEWQSLRFGGLGSEMLRGWVAGWQVFMNMFILGWVGIAMGKLCNVFFGWPLWVGLGTFSSVCVIYVLAAGYWGVVMADFQQGVIAFVMITMVCAWGVAAAGGPRSIVNRLSGMNSSCTWTVPEVRQPVAGGCVRIKDAATDEVLASSQGNFVVVPRGEANPRGRTNQRVKAALYEEAAPGVVLYPAAYDTVYAGQAINIVWTPQRARRLVRVEASLDEGRTWQTVEQSHYQGQRWRLNPLSFTGMFRGQFPVAWFITMLVVALLGGFGMGTSIDWYTEAQRIQSARTVRDASYSIWAGTLATIVRNTMWAVAVLGFFVLFPHIAAQKDYEMSWYIIGFKYLPVGMVGFFFAGILAIHLSTISTHLNLGALYATRDFYHHYVNPQASERRLVWVGRVATLVVLGGSFVFGLIIGEEITAWLIFALWIMAAGVWLPNILQVIWWRFNSWGYLTAWVANLGLSWLVVWVLPRFGVIPELPDYLQFWSLIVLNALIYVPVTLLTKPEEMDHLVKYYVMSRPIGFWGPVKREAMRRGLL